jgi:hypothetical protein
MSQLANMRGLLTKNPNRVTVDDNDLYGFIRIGTEEYKIRAFKQRTPGRWTLKLEPVLVRSGKPAQGANNASRDLSTVSNQETPT